MRMQPALAVAVVSHDCNNKF